LYSPDGKTLWAAQPGNLLRFTVAPDGTLSAPVAVALPSANGKKPIPAGLAYTPGGQQILVTLTPPAWARPGLGLARPGLGVLTTQVRYTVRETAGTGGPLIRV
jgi:hypothetical protein